MNYLIKDIKKEERPRERFIKYGVESLSNEELLSIILKTGTKDRSVKSLAMDLLNSIDNISELKNITVNKLLSIKGIGVVKAIEIISSIELGRRIYIDKKVMKKRHNYNFNIYLNKK